MSDSDSEPSSMDASDVIDAGLAATLWGLFCERVRRSPDTVGYRDFDSIGKTWRDHTWRAIADRVDRFRAALAQEDIRPWDRIAILLPNGIDWVCLDLAAHASGLVVVALYPHDTTASNAFILGHSDARLMLLDSEARWQSFGPFRPEFLSLEKVWIRDAEAEPVARSGEPIVRWLADVLDKSGGVPPPHPAMPSDLATLIYTSGTTGRPKGVMLSHRSLLWNARASAAIVPPLRSDVFLSVLPLAHAFERTVGYYLPMIGGCIVVYARSAEGLREDLITVRPTVMLGVPLLYERMASAVRANAANNLIKRSLLRFAASVGWVRFEAAQHRGTLGLAVRVVGPILDRLVAKRILAAFGGRLRVAISGGAPLDKDVARLLIGLGMPLVEGYGLTEAAPVVASNALDDNLPGSVGRLLKGVEAKLSSEGELLVRSPSTMGGYWKNKIETARVLDAEGWLSTGDSAEIADGRTFIRGRLCEMIVLSIGEKVNPNVVEAELTRDPLFAQALVAGDRHPFLVAIIVLNAGPWNRFAAENGLDPGHPNHALSTIKLLARAMTLLSGLPRHSQVRALHLTLQPWTIEAGHLTPTLKIKRDVILQLFAREVDQLYEQRKLDDF